MPLKDSLTSIDSDTRSVRDKQWVDKRLPIDQSKKDFNYEKMSRPYETSGDRRVEPFFGYNYDQHEGEAVIKTGKSLTDVWIDTWIKSRNYIPSKRGFMFDAVKGTVECQTLFASDITIRMVSTGSGFDTTGIEFNDGSFSGANIVKINVNGVIVRVGKSYNWEDRISGNFSTIFATTQPASGSTIYSALHWFLTPANKFFMYAYSDTSIPSATSTLFTVSDTQVFTGRPLNVGDATSPAVPGHITMWTNNDGTTEPYFYIYDVNLNVMRYKLTLQTITIGANSYKMFAYKI